MGSLGGRETILLKFIVTDMKKGEELGITWLLSQTIGNFRGEGL